MSSKPILLITGANQGIGFFAAQQLLATGTYHVLLGSRDAAKGRKAVEEILGDNKDEKDSLLEAIHLDIDDDESIRKAVETVEEKFGRLDVLVNNAGISRAPGSLREHYHAVYNTNVFSQAVVTDSFLPLLRKSTLSRGRRIVFTSTELASLTRASDPKDEFPGQMFPIYRSSKAATNMVLVHYAALLGPEGFAVCGVCPGFCGTNLNGFRGPKDPRDGARVIPMAVEADKENVHGVVVKDTGKANAW